MSYGDDNTTTTPVKSPAELHGLANPQEMMKMLRDGGPVHIMEGMALIVGDAEVREVLRNSEVFSSGIDAVHIGQIRPLIPLQIDPPEHKKHRKLLDPLFAPKQVALLEPATRTMVREMIQPLVDQGGCNYHEAFAEPLPTTVFLQLLGLPVSRRKEFIALKDGIIRPGTDEPEERNRIITETGQKIYAVLEEVLAERVKEPKDDLISQFLTAEVDGEQLTHDEIVDICYLFFLAGLDTVTASLDCIMAYLAQHPEQRQRLVDDPSMIGHAIEELLRWETPVSGVLRITTTDTELGGCPIPAHTTTRVILGSANTDEKRWERVTEVDFDRPENKHIAFGGGAHRCLGSHLARMELRVALEEWHAMIPEYRIADGVTLEYTQGIRAVENLHLAW